MRILRALGGSLLWIVAGVLGLVGVLLCATIILLPVGIPVLMLARKVFALAMALMLPRKVRHPVEELEKTVTGAGKKAGEKAGETAGKAGEKAGKAGEKGRSFLKRARKQIG